MVEVTWRLLTLSQIIGIHVYGRNTRNALDAASKDGSKRANAELAAGQRNLRVRYVAWTSGVSVWHLVARS
jgi:hypothetical protein